MKLVLPLLVLCMLVSSSALAGSPANSDLVHTAFNAQRLPSQPQTIKDKIEQASEQAEVRFTALQRSIQALLPPFLFSVTSFPLYALKLDTLQGNKASLANIFIALPGYVAMVTPALGAQTVTNELLAKEDDSSLKQLGIGMASGVAAALIFNPTEIIATQQRKLRQPLFFKTSSHLFKTHGPKIFLRGIPATLLRDMASGLGFFFLPPLLTKMLPESQQDSILGQAFVLTVSGGVAGYVSMPLDVIRDRMHAMTGKKVPSSWAMAKRIHQGKVLNDKGVRIGLFKSGIYRAARVAFAANVLIFTAQGLEALHTRTNQRKLPPPPSLHIETLRTKSDLAREAMLRQRIQAIRRRVENS